VICDIRQNYYLPITAHGSGYTRYEGQTKNILFSAKHSLVAACLMPPLLQIGRIKLYIYRTCILRWNCIIMPLPHRVGL